MNYGWINIANAWVGCHSNITKVKLDMKLQQDTEGILKFNDYTDIDNVVQVVLFNIQQVILFLICFNIKSINIFHEEERCALAFQVRRRNNWNILRLLLKNYSQALQVPFNCYCVIIIVINIINTRTSQQQSYNCRNCAMNLIRIRIAPNKFV